MSVEFILPIVTSPPSPPAGKGCIQPKSGSTGFNDILQNQIDQITAAEPKSESEPVQKSTNLEKSKAVTNESNPTQGIDQGEDQNKEVTEKTTSEPEQTLGIVYVQPSLATGITPTQTEVVQTVEIEQSVTTPKIEAAAVESLPQPSAELTETKSDNAKAEQSVPVQANPVELQPAAPARPEVKLSEPSKVEGQVDADQVNQLARNLESPILPTDQNQTVKSMSETDPQKPVVKVESSSQVKINESAKSSPDIKPVENTPVLDKPNTVAAQPVKQGMEAAVVEDGDPPPLAKNRAPAEVAPAAVEQLTSKSATPVHQFSEPARLAEAQTTNILQQITNQLDGLVRSGRQILRLQLNPQDLGTIDLKVTHTQQGVSVSLMAENGSTGKLLETQLGHLRQTLMEAGVQINQLHVGVHSGSGGSGQAFSQEMHRSHRSSKIQAVNDHVLEPVGMNPSKISMIDYKI